MKIKELRPEEAFALGKAMPYALLRTLSTFNLGRTPAEFPPAEEILEARFFSRDAEIRIVFNGDSLYAALLSEDAEDEYIDHELSLENSRFGKKIYVRHVIRYDEDGQASMSSGRLYDWEGGDPDV